VHRSSCHLYNWGGIFQPPKDFSGLTEGVAASNWEGSTLPTPPPRQIKHCLGPFRLYNLVRKRRSRNSVQFALITVSSLMEGTLHRALTAMPCRRSQKRCRDSVRGLRNNYGQQLDGPLVCVVGLIERDQLTEAAAPQLGLNEAD
jgi:hypothetical protein